MLLTKEHILELSKNNNINELCTCYMICEKLLDEYSDTIDFDIISKSQRLSETFIEKYADKVNWLYITKYQQLSENFIEKHSDNIAWEYVGLYNTNLSYNFIQKYYDKLNPENIIKQKNLPQEYKDNIIVTNDLNNFNNNFFSKLKKLFLKIKHYL